MLERTGAIMNKVLETITFVLAYPTVCVHITSVYAALFMRHICLWGSLDYSTAVPKREWKCPDTECCTAEIYSENTVITSNMTLTYFVLYILSPITFDNNIQSGKTEQDTNE